MLTTTLFNSDEHRCLLIAMAVLQEMISGVVRDGNITKPFINLCTHLLVRERVLQAAKPFFCWELTMDQRLVPLIPAMRRRSQSELVPSILVLSHNKRTTCVLVQAVSQNSW